jgi:hypothetical protein
MPSLASIAHACLPHAVRLPLVGARRLLGKRQVLLACFPKSGSTFISGKIAALPGFCQTSFIPGGDRREQEIASQSLRESLTGCLLHHQVAQHHTRCSSKTLHLIDLYDLRVVVLVRSLQDCLVSIVDHWKRESCIAPHAFWTDQLLDDVEASGISRLEAATITVAPWYINFYLSWLEGTRHARGPKPIWLTYESFFAHPRREFATLLDRLDLHYGDDDIERAWKARTPDRFNVGAVGRGTAAFDADPGAARALQRLVRLYPKVDLSPILSSPRGAASPEAGVAERQQP